MTAAAYVPRTKWREGERPDGTLSDRDRFINAWLLLIGAAELPKGSNRGRYVGGVLADADQPAGEPWCMAQASRVGRAMFGRRWKLPNTASCDVALEAARALAFLVETPEPGDLFFVMHGARDARHVGCVTRRFLDRSWRTAEGNAAPEGAADTREGTEVADRTRGHNGDTVPYLFVRLFTPEGDLR